MRLDWSCGSARWQHAMIPALMSQLYSFTVLGVGFKSARKEEVSDHECFAPRVRIIILANYYMAD